MKRPVFIHDTQLGSSDGIYSRQNKNKHQRCFMDSIELQKLLTSQDVEVDHKVHMVLSFLS